MAFICLKVPLCHTRHSNHAALNAKYHFLQHEAMLGLCPEDIVCKFLESEKILNSKPTHTRDFFSFEFLFLQSKPQKFFI